MCGADTWQSLAEVLAGMGLAAAGSGRTEPTAADAQAGGETGRAHNAGGGRGGVVIEFGERGAHRSAPQSMASQIRKCNRITGQNLDSNPRRTAPLGLGP
jgi:hypothetical protein